MESMPLDPIILLLSPAAKCLEIEAFQSRVRPRTTRSGFPETQFAIYVQHQQFE
jgi:hypothetical protein